MTDSLLVHLDIYIVLRRYKYDYFALCKDDGKLYLYNKNNSFNDITGYFSLYESQSDIDSITQEDIDLIIKKIKEAL